MLQFLLLLTDQSNHEKITCIYDNYHRFMMNFTVSKLKNMGRRNYVFDSEDIVQNSFMKITRYIHDIDFSMGEKMIKNYVFAILNNEICNFLNNNEELEEIEEDFLEQEEYDFIEVLSIRERYNSVVKAIEALDDRYSSTLFLFYCKEMSVNRISELMGISVKTIYTRIARGKTLLLDSLEGVEFDA